MQVTTTHLKEITLECTYCAARVPLRDFKGACSICGETIVEARYDMGGIDVQDWLETLRDRPASLWRYHEILPVYDTGNIVSFGEGGTPLIKSEALAASLGLKHLYIKDERQGPTGSFKDRQAALTFVETMEALHQDPSRKDLAWLLGIDTDITDVGVRQCEVKNWIERLVLPSIRK